MKIITMHEAKTHLSRLVDMTLAGEEVVIARRDQPLVRLSIYGEKTVCRKIGAMPDLVIKMSDHFNDAVEDWAGSIVPMTTGRSNRKK
jgi:antitoxin (DNA-binding transcriptional repressor) of toxin-antitoxin stability system